MASWQDRLREAAYNSPSGKRLTFLYDDVSREVEKKTASFDFTGVDGTYVQDNGATGRRYPLRLIFSGDNCDTDATAFEAALLERGPGVLEHPAYGTIVVVPFGTFTRSDKLVTAANEVTIEVTFWETLGVIYPTGQRDPGAFIVNVLAEFNAKFADEFKSKVNTNSPGPRASFRSRFQAALNKARAILAPIAATVEEVKRQFDAIDDSINRSIDVLVRDPLTLAFQTSQLIQTPALVAGNVGDRLQAYKALAGSIFSGHGADTNAFHNDELFASGAVTGSIYSALQTQFATKAEALTAAGELLQQFDDLTAWRDANYDAFGEIDTGESYQSLQEAVSLAAGFLVSLSFDLRQERRLILDRPRTIVDLVAELYGSIDDRLDFFIQSNALSGDEILELPRGREIVYYL